MAEKKCSSQGENHLAVVHHRFKLGIYLELSLLLPCPQALMHPTTTRRCQAHRPGPLWNHLAFPLAGLTKSRESVHLEEPNPLQVHPRLPGTLHIIMYKQPFHCYSTMCGVDISL